MKGDDARKGRASCRCVVINISKARTCFRDQNIRIRCTVDLFTEVIVLTLLKIHLEYKMKRILTFYNPAIL